MGHLIPHQYDRGRRRGKTSHEMHHVNSNRPAFRRKTTNDAALGVGLMGWLGRILTYCKFVFDKLYSHRHK
jgi:hypothetical protein